MIGVVSGLHIHLLHSFPYMVCHGFMVAIQDFIKVLIVVHYHELEPSTAMWGNVVAPGSVFNASAHHLSKICALFGTMKSVRTLFIDC